MNYEPCKLKFNLVVGAVLYSLVADRNIKEHIARNQSSSSDDVEVSTGGQLTTAGDTLKPRPHRLAEGRLLHGAQR